MAIYVVVTGIIGLAVGLFQLWSGLKAIRVQRTIDLHRDLTTGEVGRAADRLSTLLWKEGERRFGRNRCYAPEWPELLTAVRGTGGAGRLGEYIDSDRVVDFASSEPLRDLYALLWCFERIEAGRASRALDRVLLASLIEPHAAWWSCALQHVRPSDTTHVSALRRLTSSFSDASMSAAERDFESPAAA